MFLCVPYTYTLMLFLFYLKAAVCLVFCVLLLNREISHLGSNEGTHNADSVIESKAIYYLQYYRLRV